MKLSVMYIDGQNDFTVKTGALYVPNADENIKRGASMIMRLLPRITEMFITMDSHKVFDISHPEYWVLENGKAPGPITQVTLDANGVFHFHDLLNNVKSIGRPRVASLIPRTQKYLRDLAANGRYPHTIWPEHCLIGDFGHNLNPELSAAIHEWERKRIATATIVTKGSNPYTEHFSAVKAEVPDPQDLSTQLNRPLVKSIEESDLCIWLGEARSHCLANTMRDTLEAFSDPAAIRKQWLAMDATSDVGGFEKYGEDFVAEMKAKGVNLTTTVDFLA